MFDYGMICLLFSLILLQQSTGVSDEDFVGWWEVGAEQLQKQLKAIYRTLSDSNCCD